MDILQCANLQVAERDQTLNIKRAVTSARLPWAAQSGAGRAAAAGPNIPVPAAATAARRRPDGGKIELLSEYFRLTTVTGSLRLVIESCQTAP